MLLLSTYEYALCEATGRICEFRSKLVKTPYLKYFFLSQIAYDRNSLLLYSVSTSKDETGSEQDRDRRLFHRKCSSGAAKPLVCLRCPLLKITVGTGLASSFYAATINAIQTAWTDGIIIPKVARLGNHSGLSYLTYLQHTCIAKRSNA